MRQLLIGVDGGSEPASRKGRLMSISAHVSNLALSYEPAKKLPAASACSTTDTLSDVSDDHDASSSMAESPHVGAPTGMQQSRLRANAPEFLPHDMCHAKLDRTTYEVSFPDLATQGLCQQDAAFFNGGLHCHIEQPPGTSAGNTVPNVLDSASQRYLEWRQFCDLTMVVPDVCPQRFGHCDAHACTLEQLFAMSKPGELLVF